MNRLINMLPPMLGLDGENIGVATPDAPLNAHYTAIVNGKQVFVFPTSDGQWYVAVSKVLGARNSQEIGSFDERRGTFVEADPILLRAVFERLTSGGNEK